MVGLLLISSPIWAQSAFGISRGQSISTLKIVKKFDSSLYSVIPPAPNFEFESYTVLATPATGVCKISGIGKDHDDDAYGGASQSAFERLESALEEKYGNHKHYDFIRNGALWDEPREWVMAIKQNERFFASFWDAEESSNLPSGLNSISLELLATSSSSSYIKLTYEFSNFDQCKANFSKTDNNSL